MFFCDNPPNVLIVIALLFTRTQERLESKMNKIKLGKASADQIEASQSEMEFCFGTTQDLLASLRTHILT